MAPREPGRPSSTLAPVTDHAPTWEEVARDHGRFLYTVAHRLTGNDDDAHDLVQETLLRVRRGLETYEPGVLNAWLARICTNVFLDELRRRRRRPVELSALDPDRVMIPAPAPDEVSTLLSRDVEAALAALPEEFRVAVVLCDVAGLGYEEIARAVRVPVGTVRSRIHRGRRLLRAALTTGAAR
jgi:RNA polymerase sigma factor (sigma-70 family)